MSRKRDLSSDISHDERIAELSESEHGYLAVALYMMAIPQADDWGRLPGSPREFKMLVCPGFDTPKQEIDAVLSEIAALGLWERYEVGGKSFIAFPPDAWFKRQSYINIGKRTNDSGSLYPANQQFLEYSAAQTAGKPAPEQPNGKERQGTAENGKERHYAGASPSPSPSLTPSPSPKEPVLKKEPAAGKPPVADEKAENAVKVFIDLFTEKTGQPPDVPPRYTKALKEMLVRAGPVRFQAAVAAYLADAFASENGYSVSLFTTLPMDRWAGAGRNNTNGSHSRPAEHADANLLAGWEKQKAEDRARIEARDAERARQSAV